MAILRKSLNLDFVKMANQLGVVNDPIVAFTRASTATRVNPTTGAIEVIAANLPCLTAACNLAAGVASVGATYLGGLIIAGASGGRAADVASFDVTKIWNAAATIVCQVDFGPVSGVYQTAIDGTSDSGIYVYRAIDGSIKIIIRSGGATIAQATIAGQYTRANVAVCVEGNTCRYAVNGAVATMAISTVPAATVMRIGATYGGADVLNGTVQSVSYMPYALDAYTLRAITTTTGGSEALPVSPSVFNFLGVVGTQAAMLSLGGKKGDWCIRSDTGTNWIITGTDPTSITSWAQIPYPASPVTSVAGRTGAVVLTKADIGFGNVDPAWFDQAVKSTSSPFFQNLSLYAPGQTDPGLIGAPQFRIVGADATAVLLQQDSFSAAQALVTRRANGTSAAKAALASGDDIYSIIARGYNGSAYTGTAAQLVFSASENWTAARNGTKFRILTVLNGSVVPGDRFSINESGFIGINTASAAGLFHMYSPANGEAAAVFGQDPISGVNGVRGFRIATWSDGNVYFDAKTFGSGSLLFRCGAGAENGSYRNWMVVSTSNGYVGFGTTDYNLQDRADGTTGGVVVAKDTFRYATASNDCARFSRNSGSDGALITFHRSGTIVGGVSVTSSATSFGTSSDRRLKRNFTELDDAGSLIDAIVMGRFDWVRGGKGTGALAQELYKVFPEAVIVGGDDVDESPWGVDYSKLVPIAIAEIKSLRRRISALEAA